MNKLYLRNHLNNFVGSGYGNIPRWAVRIYGHEDWSAIHKVLSEWQNQSFLEIIKDPKECDDNEMCLKMFNFIDATEPMVSNWINYDKIPPSYPG